MGKSQEYDNESISQLKGADRVRLRPAVIFGSDGLEGCQHSFFEILSNSIDEARGGFGRVIHVRRYSDWSLEVEDFGRGIPVDWNQREERYNWELVYCELYAGGKYDNNSGGHYEFSLGLNGLGACATQYSSRWFDATIRRDGKIFDLHFERGVNVGGLKIEETSRKATGSLQRWLPDTEVFTDIKIPVEYFIDVLRRQAVVNSGIEFTFDDEITDTHETFLYPEGIKGYVAELDADRGMTPVISFSSEGEGQDREDKPSYRVKAEIAFLFNNEINLLDYYHNSSWLEYGGSPDRAVKQAFTYSMDKLAKDRNKYKGNESRITFQDIQDSLILVSSSFSTVTSYENQTKKAITNKFIQSFLYQLIRDELEIWAIENFDLADKVLEQILVNKRSRESAERQRLSVRKTMMGKMDFTNRVKKFVDCRTKDVSRRELYIVEGDSALGSTKMGRDSEFQAIMPIRGKILNCLKANYSQIFKNEIITDLIKVLGCGVEIKSKSKHSKDMDSFDLDKLRWDKVIICTDADVDGFQIRTLVLAMFYRLMPTLIREGKIYIAESPLYELTYRKGREEQTYFAYDDAEKAELQKLHGGQNLTIQRSKGLGENEPEMMWTTTMNPATRRLIQVLPDDPQVTQATFDMLLGDNLQGRKDHIEADGHLYLDQLDLN